LIGTSKDKLTSSQPKSGRRIKPEELARIEMEGDAVEKEYRACECVFSEKMLLLTVFRRYVVRLMDNEKINRFIGSRSVQKLDYRGIV
jgi:hypothetical protein